MSKSINFKKEKWMTKSIKIVILVTVILFLVCCCGLLILFYDVKNQLKNKNDFFNIENEYKINLEYCNLKEKKDERTFFADGILFMTIDCNNNSTEILKQLNDWDIFQIENYSKVIDFDEKNNKILLNYVNDFSIPYVENGMSKYINKNIYDPEWSVSRSYSIVIYDLDNNILYYVSEST